MKTFEQYIREAVDFRLGGKQQKGFNQNAEGKNISELKEGDEIYFVAHYYDARAHKGYIYAVNEGTDKYIGFDVSRYDIDFIARRKSSGYHTHPEKIYTMITKFWDKLVAIMNKNDNNLLIISTTLDGLIEAASEMLKWDELIEFEKSVPIARDEKF